MSPSYIPQAYPLYAMVVTSDRYDLNPELNRDPVEPIEPADLCAVVGWDILSDPDNAKPILAELGTSVDPGSPPIWPVRDSYYQLRATVPTETERFRYAEQVAVSVRAQLARNKAKKKAGAAWPATD